MLSQNTSNVHLTPTLFPFGSSSDLNLQPGSYTCRIHAKQGNLVFHHLAYDIYNGTWSSHPDSAEPDSLTIHEGETKDFSFTCGEHYGYCDDISIVNNSLLKPAEFTCTCRRDS